MTHPFILNIHTYIHSFIHSYIYTHIHVVKYTYVYIYIYIGTNILTGKCNGEIFEVVVAKPWYYTVLAGSPKKKPLPMLVEPLLVSYPGGK